MGATLWAEIVRSVNINKITHIKGIGGFFPLKRPASAEKL
jgi:hypothetical protein